MPIPEMVGGFVISLLQNVTYDAIKAKLKDNDILAHALRDAGIRASEEFYSKFGNEFGDPNNSFLARQDNWNLIFQSIFVTAADLSIDTLNPEGFEGAKSASKEALNYFVERLQAQIRENHALDKLFAEKHHIAEQTEVKDEVKRHGQTLLNIEEKVSSFDKKQDLLYQRLVEMVSLNQPLVTVDTAHDTADKIFNEQIDIFRDLISDNQPKAAITALEKFKVLKWEDLSDHLRFRVATNIAAAKLRIGDNNKDAAKELLEAAKLAPSSQKALYNSAVAFWILEEYPRSREAADSAVANYPDNPVSFQALIRSLSVDSTCEDPLPFIPVNFLGDPDVVLQIGDFFQRKNNRTKSLKWFEKAYELRPSHLETQDVYATAILEELFSEPAIVFGRQLTEPQRMQMEEARKLLSTVWGKVKDSDVSLRFIGSVINLSNAERILGNGELALTLIEEALLRHPDNIPLNKQRCFCLVGLGKVDEACSVLKEMSDDAFEGKPIVEAETLASANRQQDALQKIEGYLAQSLTEDDEKTILANNIRIQLLNALQGKEVAVPTAVALAESHPTTAEYLLLVSNIFAANLEKSAAIVWARRADEASAAKGSYPVRNMVADTYYELELFIEAATVYRDLISSYADSKNLRRLLLSYMRGDCRAEALDLIKRLPEESLHLNYYCRLSAELFFRLGDLPEARKYLKRCLDNSPEDLEINLYYIILLERMGKKDEAVKFLEKLPKFKTGEPDEYVRLSYIYASNGMREKALDVGYKTLRRFFGDHIVHLGYCGLLLHFLKEIPEIDHVRSEQKVGPDTAFICQPDSGRKRTYIIENDPAKVFDGEINDSNPITVKVIGLRANDKFVISESSFGKEEAVIEEVKHKYLHALHDVMENFQYRFPGVPGMWMVSLRSLQDGTLDVQPVLDAITRRTGAVLRAEDLYAENPIPLALIAKYLGVHPLDCLLGMGSHGHTKIKCCIGDAPERNKAVQTIVAAGDGFIVDPFSLYTFYRLDALDVLLHVTNGNLGVTQSALDLFTELLEDRRTTGAHFSLSKKEDQFERTEFSNEDIAASLIPFTKIIDWCRENCIIVPAIGKPGVKEKEFFQGLHPVFRDTLLAAEGTRRVLISEDLHFRQLGELFFEVKGAWAQPVLQAADAVGFISPHKYHEAVLELIRMNYTFISISATDLKYHLTKAEYSISNDFLMMISTLSERATDVNSSLVVVQNLFCLLSKKHVPSGKLEKLTYTVLRYLAANPSRTAEEIIVGLILVLTKSAVIDGNITERYYLMLRELFGRWCYGHFLFLEQKLGLSLKGDF